MPAANFTKVTAPLSALSSMTPNNGSTTAVQSGPYTKAQFQSTMEGSRTIKNSKEVEHILRDYPAALELYRTGKYKVKVKYEVDVERVILVEKRTIKATSNNATVPSITQDKNQTALDSSNNMEQHRDIEKEPRQTSSRTQSQDRSVAPRTASIPNGMNTVHATISSISMVNNNQPKVDHQRAPSNEPEVSLESQKNQPTNPSDNNYQKASLNKQQGDKITRDYPKTMVPFVPQANKAANPWQQPRFQQPYFTTSTTAATATATATATTFILFISWLVEIYLTIIFEQHQQQHQQQYQQQQQQQPQQQPRPNLFMPAPFLPQQNPQYPQPYYFVQRPAAPPVYQQQQTVYPLLSTGSTIKPSIQSANNYAALCRSVSNMVGLQPSFRTFNSNQPPPPLKIPSIRPVYQFQIPTVMNPQLANMPNEPMRPTMNSNVAYVQQPRGARNRARSVDVSLRNRVPTQIPNIHQQNTAALLGHYHHHHHHRHHHREPSNPTNNVNPIAVTVKEPNIPSKERTNGVTTEKLTIRELNESFYRIDASGRLPYSSVPGVLQRYGIMLTENDLMSAAKELEYNLNESISARRLVHLLIKLGKITKSNQQPCQPPSPSMLPEDREVTDIMTQRNTSTNP
ncbi:unnamed protein product [Rotaria socialis]|uniref:Uncharacterized protein n=1 Tax=Rotaria socialis TaxID=392032 RepID=A0A818JUL0_9BILA|nr:unnamed protein product [Rotaria socialis]